MKNFTLTDVDGDASSVQYRYDFGLEAKAADESQVVTVEDNGDLIIEGYAAIFEGDDRQGENFAPGAFAAGLKSFLGSQAALCFHHRADKVLGKVLSLEEDESGVKMRARVDGAIQTHPELGTYYKQIKNGTLNGMSFGGFFKRGMINGKRKILSCDISELSVTGVPMHTGPSFSVVAGKALTSDIEIPAVPELDEEIRQSDLDNINYLLSEISEHFDRLNGITAQRNTD